MTLSELRTVCRSDFARDDASVNADRLWPDAEMNRHINRICRHVARETLCLQDSTTVAVCLIASAPVDYTTYAEGSLGALWAADSSSALYEKDVAPYLHALHASILRVDDVKWVSRGRSLTRVSVSKWQECAQWEQRIGVPTEFATDLETGKLALNLRDEATDTLQLTVRRLPLTDLSADSDTPELPLVYHDRLLNGILWQMYSKRDAETFDKVKATEHFQLFMEDLDQIRRAEIRKDNRLRHNEALAVFR